jgi:hypothetical protein
MDFKQVEPAVKRYIAKVKKEVPVKQVILFGSFATGKAKKDSDVDLVILSERFAKMDEDQRLRILYRNSVGFPYNLHAYGFTTKEFNSASPLTTLSEIKETGIVI